VGVVLGACVAECGVLQGVRCVVCCSMDLRLVPRNNMVLTIIPMEILVRMVLKLKDCKIISRFCVAVCCSVLQCVALSAVSCIIKGQH